MFFYCGLMHIVMLFDIRVSVINGREYQPSPLCWSLETCLHFICREIGHRLRPQPLATVRAKPHPRHPTPLRRGLHLQLLELLLTD